MIRSATENIIMMLPVNIAHEFLRGQSVRGDDTLSVTAAVLVDVVDGILEAVNNLNGQLEVGELSSHVLGRRRCEFHQVLEVWSGVELHFLLYKHVDDVIESLSINQALVDKEGLKSITS